jgi:hypothetical protein
MEPHLLDLYKEGRGQLHWQRTAPRIALGFSWVSQLLEAQFHGAACLFGRSNKEQPHKHHQEAFLFVD